ncbi:Beta-hexosaminidase [Novacetimonas maltaceti]|uniref:beta-N-acetylhexosaminidase n=1 Tax=Novacetimonas maltaceti TaxID=1203393 RepID=A0A2S3W551_9PROT|nr:Beta-hexosaminidase [Novacetimonas maltaceti]
MGERILAFSHMRHALLAAAMLAASGVASGVAAGAPALMPMPASYVPGARPVALTGRVEVTWQGQRSPLLDHAVERFEKRLEVLSGRAYAPEYGPVAPLQLQVDCMARDPRMLSVDMREHYRLQVDDTGVRLSADGPAGVIRGLATLLQLVDHTADGPVLDAAVIDDRPRFAWRGLLIDVSRHFMTPATLERQIDAMELARLNVLHLHLSDGQSFRVESHRYPRIQKVAARGEYYTQKQIRALVAYAAERAIRVVPEFDTPGHSFALLTAYPQYAAQTPDAMDQRQVYVDAFDPTRPETYVFLRRLYHEMAGLFPDAYFHAGGDEVRGWQWTQNPRIAAYMKAHGYADPKALQAAFTARIARMLEHDGKVMMGWDEVSEAPVPQGVMVEAWRGPKYAASAASAGHPVVVSAGYYLDLLQPAAEHYRVDPADTLSDSQKRQVIGAEAALWTETVTEEMLDARLWPRTAAIAERFWSPQDVRDPDSMEARLPAIQNELQVLGNRAQANTYRMAARLAPADPQPLLSLLSVTGPVRNYARNHQAWQYLHKVPITQQQFDTPADIAAPDSFAAQAFNRDVRAYLAGQHALKPDLRARLVAWRDNDVAMVRLVAQYPVLQPLLPVSAELAALARAGLAALDGGEHGWRDSARHAIALARQQVAASATTGAAHTLAQPPADLVQEIVPGIEALMASGRRT